MEYPDLMTRARSFSDILYFSKHIISANLYPTWQQVLKDFYSLDAIGEPKFRELVACVGMGCLHEDTEINTPLGNIKIKDLNIGDSVVSWDNARKNRVVSAIIGKKCDIKPSLNIVLNDGSDLVCSHDHKFPVMNTNNRLTDKSAETLTIDDELLVSRKFQYNNWYIVGFFYGDGWMGQVKKPKYMGYKKIDWSPTKRVQLYLAINRDKEKLNRIIELLHSIDTTFSVNSNPYKGMTTITLGIGMYNWLTNNNVIKEKGNYVFPSHLDNMGKMNILIGLVDSDGYDDGYSYFITNTSDEIINFAMQLLDSIGIDYSHRVDVRDDRKDKHILSFSKLKFHYQIVGISRIEKAGDQRVVDISLNITPYFELNNGILSHNSGKTYVGAIIGLYEFYKLIEMNHPTPQEHWNLDPATPIYIVNCAKSEAQAKATVFAYVRGLIFDSPYFMYLIESDKIAVRHNEFEYTDKRLFLRSEHSASGSLAGKSSKCVIFDELSKMDFTGNVGSETSASEVYSIVSKATGRFGKDGKIVSISSPMSTDDFFWRLMEKAEKRGESLRMMSLHKASWEIVDPKLRPDLMYDSSYMRAEKEKDYDKFMRDYGAQPVGRLAAFFPDIKAIQACETNNPMPIRFTADGPVLEEWFKPKGCTYIIAGDPALKHDAFGLAMGHQENKNIMVDFAIKLEVIPPALEIDARQVKNFIMSILDKGFIVTKFITDIKSYPELFQDLQKRGVMVEQSFVKKETYDYLKERISLKEIFWPKNPDLFEELSRLEVISQRRVDHPKYGSKDISDALANVAAFIKEIKQQQPAWKISDRW